MFLSLETLTSIIRTDLPILVELINLVNSVIIFLSQMTLLRCLTFLRGSQTVILIVLLFWTYFFLLTLVFVLQCLCLHWEILIMLLSQFPFTFHQIHNRMPHFISVSLWLFSCWLRWPLWSFERRSIGGSLNSVLLLLLVSFVSGFGLELMYIFLIENIRSSLIYLHGFQLPVQLP